MSEKPIVFGSEPAPEEMANYRDRIARAKGDVNSLKSPPRVPEPANFPVLKPEAPPDISINAPREGGVKPRPAGSPLLTDQTRTQLEEAAKITKALKDNPPPPPPKTREQEETEKESKEADRDATLVAKLDDLWDMLDTTEIFRAADLILNNKARKREIESRCKPMDVVDLIEKDEVRQRVPILPGKFEVVFRSTQPSEDLLVRKIMGEEKQPSALYAQQRMFLLNLSCSVVSINGVELPQHMDKGEPVQELLLTKCRALTRKSSYVVADLSVNYVWFDIRCRKLLQKAYEDLGNT